MHEHADWSAATFNGLRRAQHRAFLELPFRAKLERVEQMNEVVRRFAAKPPRTPIDPAGRTRGERPA